ncbi:MAG: UDP-N-acetylglucosamine 1-carboxyvinyltransferase [Candidatus Latescibacteria bacterium]|nr:UDP-N-acetylglucosamine 1-carboxyvinyltransferase [bacterium]MBD3424765.1 UDP-N-acetylglucosamine 1-carboxyvinyltransferase [Candidatus Latescibacterota bacterium]
MDSFLVKNSGGLEGRIRVSGAKNAMLPLMAASILAEGKSVFENVPNLRDMKTMSSLLDMLGVEVEFKNGRLTADASAIQSEEAPYSLVKQMRASIYALAPLLVRQGHARVSLPGGCAWGPRPIDQHLKGLTALGARIKIDHGYIEATARKLKGTGIILSVPSVGATVNIMMAAVMARGKTVIENAAREPEIVNLAEALGEAGAKISGAGSSTIEVEGVKEISPLASRVIPDRIEAGTFAAAAVITGGEVIIENCRPDHMRAVIQVLKECGADIETIDDSMTVKGSNRRTRAVDIETGYYPSFPTDMQAQIMSVLGLASGSSSVVENIYADRFSHVPELRRLGADIHLDGNVAVVRGVKKLEGAPVMATDIRASSALILAGLVAEGETKILRIYHIDRGYERIEEKLRGLGADIKRVNEPH